MAKLKSLGLLGLLCFAPPALAGSFTHDHVIGFSEDGRYFAFETYGLQRGSGLPYANLFVVDLPRNAWVEGTPYRARMDERKMMEVEAAPYAALGQVRADALQAAAGTLERLAIERPATRLFARGLGEVHDASAEAIISTPHPDDPTQAPLASMTLLLDSVARPGGADHCWEPDSLRGYQLSLEHPDGRGEVIHADERIPASRGCPRAYILDAVLSAGYPQEGDLGVALISVWRDGFEGLERHVIAQPVPLPTASSDNRSAGQADERSEVAGSMEEIIEGWLAGTTPRDVPAMSQALQETLPANPDSVFWPDAELSPLARAALLLEQEEPALPFTRTQFQVETRQLAPEGAGGPSTVTLVRADRFNVGPQRREDLIEELGAEVVAPAAEFGEGPHVEWRFVMRPLQGMRADLVAAGRREVSDADQQHCGLQPCHSSLPTSLAQSQEPELHALQELPFDPPYDAEHQGRLTAPAALDLLERLVGEQAAAAPEGLFVVEQDLGQDSGMEAHWFAERHSGQPAAQVLSLPGPALFVTPSWE
ncbi:DUF2259 domain-containing protein [Aquibaculum arenosum]|uniref:DUF2259 domain-containing protein n=1 Tax=Aquibaculum arenosum TaxID=3032591 RepID=A0ABT5YJ20_9PROT|nr:DUF2259 domain-containing protein [Fodinicurvata sp. CAU 1616]MDF2094780.1 DUF2259 domain-containing protein [Fodinicurvata sp. CAU 1616]